MTTFNKLNQNQKNILGEFMKEHPKLAKNMIPNCAQGKATSIRLWEDLSRKLNAVGPPVKDAKTWKKVLNYRSTSPQKVEQVEGHSRRSTSRRRKKILFRQAA
ncbi:uncharacterized protein LOC118739828 [Rhagoletis pomonella]|uniref:uncharacterized protein LOC118739828 n=1 Tax=Rhagoletis pomonella TaxID=28610 RepID=UPI00177BEF0D|nr:uncharacterized protein LOC118739828 [Rhagoletis pomonella]